jgi:HSP20 family protein
MTYLKWKTYPTLSDVFDNMFEKETAKLNRQACYDCIPAVNIAESPSGFEIELSVPGMTKEDFKINLESNVLTISSEKENKEEESRNYLRREFFSGTFSRSFTLPKNVDIESIKADYAEGILKVNLPKKAETRITKEIAVS